MDIWWMSFSSRKGSLLKTAAGNMLQFQLSPEYGDHEFKWSKVYGLSRARRCAPRPGFTVLQQDRLVMVFDPMALQYIYLELPEFPLALPASFTSSASLVGSKGDDHKQLRAIRIYRCRWPPTPVPASVCKVAQRITEQLESYEAHPVDMCPLLSDATLSSTTEGLGADFLESNSRIVTFGLLRAQVSLANREAWRLVREKSEVAKQGW
ncbi:hypothetical protein GGX14DRAFT_406487 [Mycena pura]|uniref:Uncharacterized protein n=1 Tax=Mycena pura TaxID=153505 RepID=A0AAD6UX32_9AGAR|nr:hypothetical protein GGX14DRAFT_406487 [Mycena pura]